MLFGKNTLAVVAAFAVQSTYADSIYEIAASADAFSTLAAAVDAAGLTEALDGEDGTLTVFAPPNDAFVVLGDAVDKLLDPEWKFHLQDVLLYHALGSVVKSTDLKDGLTPETLNGETILINTEPVPRINDASNIILNLTDIEADNGVIHAVENVLLPTSATSSIVDIAGNNPDFSTLVDAVIAADLVDALSGDGPFTVFAPTNKAFDDLPEGTLNAVLNDKQMLTDILLYHVVEGNVHSSQLEDGDAAITLNGAKVEIMVNDATVMVNDATVNAADILANNGIIHVIDKVILPPPEEEETEMEAEADDADEADAAAAEAPAEKACEGTTVDYILTRSGESGFDNNGHDFDILRDLVGLAKLGDALNGLEESTVFAPRDHAFYMLARALSDFTGDGKFDKDTKYNEKKVFGYLADTLTAVAEDEGTDLEGLVTNVLLYHVTDEEIIFTKHAEKGDTEVLVKTLLEDANEIPVVMAMPNEISRMRMKMLHNANTKYFKNPKIHNKLYDRKVCNGRVNVIKRVLIPLKL